MAATAILLSCISLAMSTAPALDFSTLHDGERIVHPADTGQEQIRGPFRNAALEFLTERLVAGDHSESHVSGIAFHAASSAFGGLGKGASAAGGSGDVAGALGKILGKTSMKNANASVENAAVVTAKVMRAKSPKSTSGIALLHALAAMRAKAKEAKAGHAAPDTKAKVAGSLPGASWGVEQLAGSAGRDEPAEHANTSQESSFTRAARSVGGALAEILHAWNGGAELSGHTKGEINRALLWIVLAIVFATGIGFLLPRISSRFEVRKGRPSPWVFGLLVSSYALLIPGIFTVLFSFKISLKVLGFTVGLTLGDEGGTGTTTENMLGFIRMLSESGATLGAALVVLYAMVIPFIKLLLLGVGEFWRFNADPRKVGVARACIGIVQVISKWACPDMFAYILLLYLVRSMGEKTKFIETTSQLDTGFLCFSVFCIASTFSSLCIEVPEKHPDDRPQAAPFMIRTFGHRGALLATAALAVGFALTFTIGLLSPVLSIRLNTEILQIPAIAKPFIGALHLESSLSADVSVMRCLNALGHWIWRGEASCILAFVMLAIFVVALTVLDMFLLLIAAAGLGARRECRALEEMSGTAAAAGEAGMVGSVLGIEELSSTRRSFPMSVAHVVRHFCMLDVFVMAVLIISLAAGVYRSMGLMITVQEGAWWLLAAEAMHLLTYYTVQSAVRYAEDHDVRAHSKLV